MKQMILYMKENCPLCDEAEDALQALQANWTFDIKKVNIYEDDELLEKYQLRIPVITFANEVVAEGIVTEQQLQAACERHFT